MTRSEKMAGALVLLFCFGAVGVAMLLEYVTTGYLHAAEAEPTTVSSVPAEAGGGQGKQQEMPPEEKPAEAPEEMPELPAIKTDADRVADFLDGFLSQNPSEQKAALEQFCGGSLDIYSEDLVSRGRLLREDGRPVLSEIECPVMRATMAGKFFAYGLELDKPHLDVTIMDEWGQEKDVRFMAKDFSPMRCFVARWDGHDVPNELRVLVSGKDEALMVRALGRAGYAGARSSKRRVTLLTGLLLHMKESESNVRLSTAPVPEKTVPDWDAYGWAIGADPKLFAPATKNAYRQVLEAARRFHTNWVLFNKGPELPWPAIIAKYGEPQRTEQVRLMSGKFVLNRGGLEPDLFDGSVIVHYYGPIAFAQEPGGGRIFGTILRVDARR